MQPLCIDKSSGAIRLPNGVSIEADLTQDAFLAGPASSNATSRDYGTLPWIHYHFTAGQIDGKNLAVSLCFYDQLLVHVCLTVDFYPPDAKDWSHYSLHVEAQTKQFHEQLLTDMLGRPSHGGSLLSHGLPPAKKTLERPVSWRYSWGSVFSYHDSKGGGTDICVTYGNRKEEANRAWSSGVRSS